MNKIMIGSAVGLVAALSTTFSAFAWDHNQAGSDANLRYSRAYVERAADMLSHDQEDYGGHRAAAMTEINEARADLTTALRYDNNHEDSVLPAIGTAPDYDARNWERDQSNSNQNLVLVRRDVEHAMDMLQNDRHDYGGYRAKAVQELGQARADLLAALRYR